MKYLRYLILSILFLFPITAFASGSVSVNKTSLNIAPNKSATFKVVATNAAGKVTITSSDTDIVTINKTSEWVENGTLTVTATGKKTGNAKITITVDAATFDKEVIKKTYTINVRVQSTVNTLNSIGLSNGVLSPVFNANTTNYTATIDDSSVVITAVKGDNYQTISGTGTKSLNYGINKFNVVVKSESGVSNTYTITITRPDRRSSNNNLKTLSTNQGNITFDKNTTTYNLKVNSNISSITLNATLEDDKASFVKGYGPRTINLNYGNNAIEVKVQAENTSLKTYTINVNRKDNRSNNNYLKDITLSKGDIIFNKDILEYNTTVYFDVTKLDVVALPEDSKAKVVVTNPDLKVGNNIITINVTSENMEKRTYKLIVKRLSEEEKMSDNNNISSLQVLGHDLNFDNETLEYDLKIKDEYALVFEISLEDSKAGYSIEGNKALEEGSIIRVISTSESGKTKEYKFNIHKDINNNLLKNNSIIIYICFGGIGFILGIVVTLILTKHKKKTIDNNQMY